MTALFSPSGDLLDTAFDDVVIEPAPPAEASVFEVTAAPEKVYDPFYDDLAVRKHDTHVVVRVPANVEKVIEKQQKAAPLRYRRIRQALQDLHDVGPGLRRFRTKGFTAAFYPTGCYQSRVENLSNGGAWRMWWTWGAESSIDIFKVGPHS